jgi:hypothetical protein
MTAEQIPAEILDKIQTAFWNTPEWPPDATEEDPDEPWWRCSTRSRLDALDALGWLHPGLKPCPECGAGAGEACDDQWHRSRRMWLPCPNADRRRREERP